MPQGNNNKHRAQKIDIENRLQIIAPLVPQRVDGARNHGRGSQAARQTEIQSSALRHSAVIGGVEGRETDRHRRKDNQRGGKVEVEDT